MTQDAGPYAGQDRFEARAGVIKQLEHEALLVKVEDHRHAVGHCQRCDTIVEPLVSTQWFVRIRPLAEPAIQAVKENRITFVPDNWAKTYLEWMTNIHDWCISRQLWWGPSDSSVVLRRLRRDGRAGGDPERVPVRAAPAAGDRRPRYVV